MAGFLSACRDQQLPASMGGVTLLEDIITGACGETSISSLLRQLRVLASRTGGAPLDVWVSSELNGYGPDDAVPAYRGPFRLAALGHFLGRFGAEMRNVPIPPSTFPEGMRRSAFDVELRNPIAELEEMAKSPASTVGWPADMVQFYNSLVAQGVIQRFLRDDFVLAQVQQPLPAHMVVGVLDAVRTRALDVALELEREAPSAGEPAASAEVRERASTIINNYFNAPSNIAIQSPGSQLTVPPPAAGDVDGLIAFLSAAGLSPLQLRGLSDAVAEDGANGSASTGRWERVRAWFGAAMTDVGTGAAGSALAAAAAGFLGSV